MITVIVAAVARNGVIGRGGGLPWHIPEDLARFQQLTMGQSLIMGRKTFESIGRVLPGRTTVVVTGQADWAAPPEVEVVHSVAGAIDVARRRGEDAFVVGGAEIYRQALEMADVLDLTEVHDEPDGDTWFPPVDWSDWEELGREDHEEFSFVTYARRPAPARSDL